MSILINIEDLLSGNVVEDTRTEFKEGWNPKPIMRSVCAFANDFENEGSGYIIIEIPIHSEFSLHGNTQADTQATTQDNEHGNSELNIIEFCKEAKTRQEIQDYIGFKNREYFRKKILNPMIEKGLLLLQYPDMPKSPNQKYYSK